MLKNKRIAIVGGGPGGLTLARLLQVKGVDNVKVYERDYGKEARIQGATLDLHDDSGLEALRQAGLIEAFKSNYRPGADKMRLVNKHATILYDEHTIDKDDMFRPEIDRGPLRKLLLDSLKDDTVVWDCYLTSMEKENGLWKLSFKNGTHATADIVIAADGANSKIRPLITDIKPFYVGMTVIEGAVYNSATATPRVHELLGGGKIFALGNGNSLIVSSKGDGSLVFYTGSKTSENWCRNCGVDFTDKSQVRNWFKKEFSGWDSVWLELFDNAEPNFIVRPQYCMPVEQTWNALPDVTMLGDAAHLMPPYAGEGVNMAMLDALELSQSLTNSEFFTVQEAIANYETKMRERASEVAEITLQQTDSMHSDRGLEDLLGMFNPGGS